METDFTINEFPLKKLMAAPVTDVFCCKQRK